MRITIPGDIDLEVRAGAPAADIATAAGATTLWCGEVLLDADHPAGAPPLVHGARLTAARAPAPWAATTAARQVLRVVEGPDAGASVALRAPGIVVGRAAQCDLVIDDPAISSVHFLVAADGRVRHARSLNGIDAGPRLPLRPLRLRPGTSLQVGRSRIRMEQDGSHIPEAPAHPRPPWGPLAAGLAAGVAIAALTGRWYLALIGIAAPVAMLAPSLVRRIAAPPEPSEPWTPPEGPIAIVGTRRWALGYARAVAVARGRAPAGTDWQEPWMRWLDPSTESDLLVHVAPREQVPSWCTSVVAVGPRERVETVKGSPVQGLPLAMSARVAEAAARAHAGARAVDALPDAVRWADLRAAPNPRARPPTAPGPRRLRVRIGASARGAAILDLDEDGPHLLVAGTTGSGKSVALETLVADLALAHSPRDLAIALVDFKGGAGLRSCRDLPHVCGALTDLDGALASRVIDALSDELSERKRTVAERGHSSLSEWECAGDAPPRLLVVMDEYQEIVSRHPGFLPDLSRIAAQGRSLGLHLVLATQRPAGAVTPEVRANLSTTIALRVASVAESRDLIGTAAAASIPPHAPGRAILVRGTEHHEVQVAAPVVDPTPSVHRSGEPLPRGRALATAARQRWSEAPRTPLLWLPPLPGRFEPEPHERILVALADWPRERRQHAVAWDPTDGPLVIVGPARSGRTAALRAVAAQASSCGLRPVWLPAPAREAARTVHLAGRASDVLLMVDDAERALARLGEADDGAAVDALLARLSTRGATALACAPHAPVRVAAAAATLAVLPAADAPAASPWGTPRDRSLSASGPGRAWLSQADGWVEAQLAGADQAPAHVLTHPLSTPPPGTWAVGGDAAEPLTEPTGRVAVVGAPGPERDRIAATLTRASVTCHDAPHLAPAADAILLTDPTPRALRSLAPRDWQGIAPPTPSRTECALIIGGAARAVRLASE